LEGVFEFEGDGQEKRQAVLITSRAAGSVDRQYAERPTFLIENQKNVECADPQSMVWRHPTQPAFTRCS
jgi:hypothetical protein